MSATPVAPAGSQESPSLLPMAPQRDSRRSVHSHRTTGVVSVFSRKLTTLVAVGAAVVAVAVGGVVAIGNSNSSNGASGSASAAQAAGPRQGPGPSQAPRS